MSQICYNLSPKYHVGASSDKYQRLAAFRNSKGNPTHFINIASISGTLPKDKYLVAIQMNPNVEEAISSIQENILIKSVEWDVVDPNSSDLKIVDGST